MYACTPVRTPATPRIARPVWASTGAGTSAGVRRVGEERFSGGTHGFVVGHSTPEAQHGGLIALLKDGDRILIDAVENRLEALIDEEEIQRRREAWQAPPLKASKGILYKYIKSVSSASQGCVTDEDTSVDIKNRSYEKPEL